MTSITGRHRALSLSLLLLVGALVASSPRPVHGEEDAIEIDVSAIGDTTRSGGGDGSGGGGGATEWPAGAVDLEGVEVKLSEGEDVAVTTKGPVPVLVAVKALALAQDYLAEDSIDIKFAVQFRDLEERGQTSTFLHFAILSRNL